MTEQSNIETFVEWAKGRLDEMSAAASALEAKLGELEGNFKTEAEAAIAQQKKEGTKTHFPSTSLLLRGCTIFILYMAYACQVKIQ